LPDTWTYLLNIYNHTIRTLLALPLISNEARRPRKGRRLTSITLPSALLISLRNSPTESLGKRPLFAAGPLLASIRGQKFQLFLELGLSDWL